MSTRYLVKTDAARNRSDSGDDCVHIKGSACSGDGKTMG